LLIDEINALDPRISSAVGSVLKKYFLDKRNRVLIMTSHIPVHLDSVGRPVESGQFSIVGFVQAWYKTLSTADDAYMHQH
jgi:hypothetical protein